MSLSKRIIRIAGLLSAIALVGGASLLKAQEVKLPHEALTSVSKAALYIPGTIIKSAEQMPEEYYTFRPTPEVRSFGELMAHIAESNYEMCAIAKGEEQPVLKVGTTKAKVLEALKKSFDYCKTARDSMTEERAKTVVKFMGGKQPAGQILDFSVFHSLQHYGNVIVYMRLKGLVPPSSQPGSPGNAPKPEAAEEH